MLTQKELKNLLHYDPTSGLFTWINGGKGTRGKGRMAGRINSNGYLCIVINGKEYRSGRLAFLYMAGYSPEHDVDHKDRNRANDKWSNLRHVSRQCNNRNCTISPLNTSGIKGIGWYKNKNKWEVRIGINGKRKCLGYFDSFDEAICHRLAAEQCLDWSDCDNSSTAFQHVKNMLLKNE